MIPTGNTRVDKSLKDLERRLSPQHRGVPRGEVGATAQIVKSGSKEVVRYTFTSSGEKAITHHLGRVPTDYEVSFERAGNFTTNPSVWRDTDGTAWTKAKIHLKSMGDYTGGGFTAVLTIY